MSNTVSKKIFHFKWIQRKKCEVGFCCIVSLFSKRFQRNCDGDFTAYDFPFLFKVSLLSFKEIFLSFKIFLLKFLTRSGKTILIYVSNSFKHLFIINKKECYGTFKLIK